MIPSFFRLHCVEQTTSTNEDARRAAEAGEEAGLVIQAHQQSAGKGRQEREWVSPAGNLYLSILLRPACSPQEASLYSFAVALAVYDTVAALLPEAKIELKWPNDVLVEGKKISGILLEAAPAQEGKIDWLVLGMGLNVASYPQKMDFSATSLTHLGLKKPDLSLILEKYLENLDRWCLTLVEDSFDHLRREWLVRARKGQITARTAQETVTGQFGGLDMLGRLVIKLADGVERKISAADVFFS